VKNQVTSTLKYSEFKNLIFIFLVRSYCLGRVVLRLHILQRTFTLSLE